MLPCNIQFHLCDQSTFQSEMYDDFLVVRNYGKLSAKFLFSTSTVIEKVGLIFCSNIIGLKFEKRLKRDWLRRIFGFRFISLGKYKTDVYKLAPSGVLEKL